MGKITGGIIGMLLLDLMGIPFGALWGFLLGSIIGHLFIDQSKAFDDQQPQYRASQRRRGAFIYHLLCLCARLAKADGPVNRLEIQFMEQLMRQRLNLSDRGRRDAIRIWNEAKSSNTSFGTYAQAFYHDFAQERHRVLDMLDVLFALAAADSTRLHPAEEELLLRAAGLFHISRLQFDRIKSRYFTTPTHTSPAWSALDPYYALLGATPADSVETIKKKYREQALKWHPDRVQARGGSAESIRHAQEKFRQIKEAYEKVMEARGQKR
ncbi:MAG: TerB family tellurite resistance protein [Saprospiraceae bacterium]|nr:TerB family tellurite resistance protein [Saprospiraceae bacterium]MDW8230404.1 TerB family tellurite resistance protein [Saprospiraceae bacterium]